MNVDVIFEDRRTGEEIFRTVDGHVPEVKTKVIFKDILWSVNDVFTDYYQPPHSRVKIRKIVVTLVSLGKFRT